MQRINEKLLVEQCKKNDLYTTPHLNDKLYLHFLGLEEISGLEKYSKLQGATTRSASHSYPNAMLCCVVVLVPEPADLAALWLENNALVEIEGLDHMQQLSNLCVDRCAGHNS